MEEWGGLYPCKCSLLVAVRRGKIPLAVSAAQPPSLIYARGSRGLMAAEKDGEKADGRVSSKDTLANSERDQCHAQPKHVAAASLYSTKIEVTVQVTNLQTHKFSPSMLRVSAEAATALAPRGSDRNECKAAGAVK